MHGWRKFFFKPSRSYITRSTAAISLSAGFFTWGEKSEDTTSEIPKQTIVKDYDPDKPHTKPYWLDDKTASVKLNMENLDIVELLKKAGAMQYIFMNNRDDCVFEDKPVTLERIEGLLLMANEKAKLQVETEPTILINTVSTLGKFYLEVANQGTQAEACYKLLNRLLTGNMKKKLEDNEVLHATIKLAQAYFLQHKDKEFADTLNIVEHLAEKSILQMRKGDLEIPENLSEIDYTEASDALKYFMDTCVIRAMVLGRVFQNLNLNCKSFFKNFDKIRQDMWVKNYYARNLPATDIISLARKAVEATSVIYTHTTMQSLSIKANLAAILKEQKETLKEAYNRGSNFSRIGLSSI